MSECHRTKILLKGIMIVFKTKGPQIRCIPHGSFGLSQCKSSSKKTCWLTKSLKRQKQILKKKGPEKRCIPHGRWRLAQRKLTWEEHAGYDKIFENITLCLDQLPLKIQFTKEKRTLKTLVLSPEAYSYLNVNRVVKNKLVLTKIWA